MWLDVSPRFSIELDYMFNLVVIFLCSKNIDIFMDSSHKLSAYTVGHIFVAYMAGGSDTN